MNIRNNRKAKKVARAMFTLTAKAILFAIAVVFTYCWLVPIEGPVRDSPIAVGRIVSTSIVLVVIVVYAVNLWDWSKSNE